MSYPVRGSCFYCWSFINTREWKGSAGLRACSDLRDNYTPGHKYSQWELKGACLRLELGPKDMEKQSVVCVRRDTGKKEFIPWGALQERVPAVLEEMHDGMLEAARAKVNAARVTVRLLLRVVLVLLALPAVACQDAVCLELAAEPCSKYDGNVK